MKIKLTKDLPARQVHLEVLAAGSVIDISERRAIFLAGRGFGDLLDKPAVKPAAKPAPEPVEPVPAGEEPAEDGSEKPKRKAKG